MSVRVSMSAEPAACSGLMVSGVPTSCRCSVCTASLFTRSLVAFATPKSITFACGFPSCVLARMFPGFRSRWMMPFVCACCTALQTCMNSQSRFGIESFLRSQ